MLALLVCAFFCLFRFWYGAYFCSGHCKAFRVSMRVFSFCTGQRSPFRKKMNSLDRRTRSWPQKLITRAARLVGQIILVGQLESPRSSLGVLHQLLWGFSASTREQSSEKQQRSCQGLSGSPVDVCAEEAWAIAPAIWQLRSTSAETRPSLKCELCHFSKLRVARNDWEASDSFRVNVKVPEGLI